MNCIRCGRTIPDGTLLCPLCSDAEEAPPIVPRPAPIVAPQPTGKPKRVAVPAAQRKLRRAVWLLSALCICLLSATGTLVYLQFFRTAAQEQANQPVLARTQDDYQSISAALNNTQEQLETAKTTIARQNSRLLVLEDLFNGTDIDEATRTLVENSETLSVQVIEREATIEDLSAQVSGLTTNLTSLQNQLDFYHENIVLVSEKDTYYHIYGCPHLDVDGSWRPIRLDSDEAESYRPCSECCKK